MSVGLVIQHAKSMLHTGTSSVASLALPCSPTASCKQHSFPLKLMDIKCVAFSTTFLSETFLNIRRTKRDMIKYVYRSSFNLLATDFFFKF